MSDLPTTMQAVACSAPNRFEIIERPVPQPRPDEILVETKAVGLCTSDISIITGKMPDVTFPTERFGHEPSGIVRAVGSAVSRLAPGDRVTTLWARDGFMQFADYYCVNERFAFALPAEVPFAHGLCEPLSAVLRSIGGAGLRTGDNVAVLGVGYFGLLMVQAARLLGAWRVVALDKSPRRLAIARELGADAAYDVAEDGAARALKEFTDGKGFDLVIECAGVQGAIDTAVDLVRPGGSVYVYAWHARPETVRPHTWLKGFKLLSNPACEGFDIARWHRLCEVGIEWLRRRLWRVDPLVTSITAREGLMAAIEQLANRPDEVVKVVICPSAGPMV